MSTPAIYWRPVKEGGEGEKVRYSFVWRTCFERRVCSLLLLAVWIMDGRMLNVEEGGG